jgi:hypothetical protein
MSPTSAAWNCLGRRGGQANLEDDPHCASL